MERCQKKSTRGLKTGDIVIYDDGNRNFLATVVKITSAHKAQIRTDKYIDEVFNGKYIVNTYRKFMTIQRE